MTIKVEASHGIPLSAGVALDADWEPRAGSPAHQALAAAPKRFMEPVETILIEHRAFVRDCLVHCLADSGFSRSVRQFATVDDLLESGYSPLKSTIFLLCTGERSLEEIEHDCSRLNSIAGADSKIVLLAHDENTKRVVTALQGGVKGYIPMSVPFDVALQAINLVRAGGVFIPPGCIADPKCSATAQPEKSALEMLFSSRQAMVVDAMCKGKSNKIIAYELTMAEATVKVHVRNIMRKLKARNRTEVAFLINGMH